MLETTAGLILIGVAFLYVRRSRRRLLGKPVASGRSRYFQRVFRTRAHVTYVAVTLFLVMTFVSWVASIVAWLTG